MDELIKAINEKHGLGISEDIGADKIKTIAKALGFNISEYVERKPIEIVEYTNKNEETNLFVRTAPYVVGRKKNGSPQTVRGLFLRIEALDDVIADLQAARGLLRGE